MASRDTRPFLRASIQKALDLLSSGDFDDYAVLDARVILNNVIARLTEEIESEPIKVRRELIYEGDRDWVMRTLHNSQSVQEGKQQMGPGRFITSSWEIVND